jgi:hypothetical protein
MHTLLAPYLTPIGANGGLYSSVSVSANMTSTASSSAVPASVATGPITTSFQPLVANLYLLLRALVDRGMTVLVANVLERDRIASTSSVSGGGGYTGLGGRSVSMAGPALSVRLPVGTGASSGSDVFDIVLVLSRVEGADSDLHSVFTADIALRPPQFNARPSTCELRIAKI